MDFIIKKIFSFTLQAAAAKAAGQVYVDSDNSQNLNGQSAYQTDADSLQLPPTPTVSISHFKLYIYKHTACLKKIFIILFKHQ